MAVYRVGSNKSSGNNFPSVRPSLDLDFANSKALDSRITFTRASGGSYVGADGLIKYAGVNEARFGHDPETGESLGLLVEESRTNLVLRSEDFNNIYWIKEDTRVDPQIFITPNGDNLTYKLIESNSSSTHSIRFAGTAFNANTFYTFSIFVKPSELNSIQMQFGAGAFGGANPTTRFLLNENRFVFGGGGTNQSAKISKYANNWYRIETTIQATNTSTAGVSLFLFKDGSRNYQGDGSSGIFIWGAQLEQGAFPTSYIPTLGSARTRAADNARIVGKNFTDFYNANESTIYTEARGVNVFQSGNTRRYWELGTSSNFRTLSGYRNLNSTRLFSINNGVVSADIRQTNQVIDSRFIKSISAFKNSYFSLYSTGKKDDEQIASSGKLPDVNTIKFGYISNFNFNLGTVLNGTIKRFIYWPKILPNEQLQALTR